VRGVLKLTWVEMKLFVREPLAAFFTLVFPLILLAVFGGIFGNAPTPEYGGLGFVDMSVPAYTVIVIGTGGLLSLSTNLAGYRDAGVLRRLCVTPLRPLAILLAQAVVTFAMALAGTAGLLAYGALGFGLRCGGGVVALGGAFVLACVALFALGFVVASIAPTARSAQALGLAIFYPMIFLSGAAIPRDLLPGTVQRIAVALPMTHAVSLLQGLWMGEPWRMHAVEIAVLTIVGLAAGAVAARSFRWE
jgi:ABC-2 type transport system permease protein